VIATPSIEKSTHQNLKKIPSVPGLYRHQTNGSYYGKKKIRGEKKVKALRTSDGANITDRKIAEKALAFWIASLAAPAPLAQEITFKELWAMFVAQKKGQAQKTLKKCDWVKQCLDVDFPAIWSMRVASIKTSHLAAFFARRQTMKAASYNAMTEHIKNAFTVAVTDEIIPSNPYDKLPKHLKRMKNVSNPDTVPTIEECEKLVAHVRGQEFADTADKSADMLALMHLAGLGQAELIALDWRDVDWGGERVIIRERVKTGVYFEVPFYPHLTPFLVDLWKRQGEPKTGKVVSILTPAIALANACKRLKMPRYSPRDFRKARIVWMLRRGVPVESIAKWQGHRDNGVLIRRTYSNVITSLDKEFEKAQLAKMA